MKKKGDSICSNNHCPTKNSAVPETMDEFLEQQALRERMSKIRHKILVMSGKGGVGKSTIAVNMAISLALSNAKVGLLDIDIHGPSIPRLLGIEAYKPSPTSVSLEPVRYAFAHRVMKVMSIGFLLPNRDDAVIWRGPMKMGVIKQFLKDVEWGDLDFLVIDSPPGTGDEPLSICQLIEGLDGAIIVTTPQELSLLDVRKSIKFCRQLKLPVLGVIENMSGMVCPKCGEEIDIFTTGGGKKMASEMSVPFLGSIPFDPFVVKTGDDGKPFIYHYSNTETSKAFQEIIEPILALKDESVPVEKPGKEGNMVKIALPIADGRLCMHFGHCERFAIIEVEGEKIMGTNYLNPPPHEPGVLPKWLNEQGVNMIIAGGMGHRAQEFFQQYGITVVVGAPALEPEEIVKQYLAGTLVTSENICDH
ncbi:MAG: iron-sulfur cluster carrier protein MrpORP [bacterium]